VKKRIEIRLVTARPRVSKYIIQQIFIRELYAKNIAENFVKKDEEKYCEYIFDKRNRLFEQH